MQIPLDTKYTKYVAASCKYCPFLKRMQLTCTDSARFTGHKQGTVASLSANYCQGQLKTPQSLTIFPLNNSSTV